MFYTRGEQSIPIMCWKGWKECEECQLRTEYEPKDPYGAGRQICFKAMEIMEESENYAVPTFYDDTCDDWEEKMNDKCLDCKYCEVEEEGAFGLVGESCFHCRICEEDTEDKQLCFEEK